MILILIPVGLGALLIPPIVSEVEDLASNAPEYAQDVEEFVAENDTLKNLNEDYDITTKLSEEAEKLPDKIPDAAGVLSDIGVGFVNSVFAGVTILILSVFMVAGGPRWVSSFVEAQRPEHAERIERTLRRIANAVGNYVGGALIQATIAGLAAFIVLKILGVPFAGPLALLVFFFDLIPVIGATIAAFLVAIVMLFVNFPVGADRLGRLRDRLPAGRELPDPAPDPEARDRDRALRRPRRRALRQHPVRHHRRHAGDPDRGLDPDRHPRVARVPAQPDRRPRRRPAPRRRAGARPALSGRASSQPVGSSSTLSCSVPGLRSSSKSSWARESGATSVTRLAAGISPEASSSIAREKSSRR